MIDLSKHIQEGALLELEALELSTDECSFLSAQNSAQAMQIDALKADLAAAQSELERVRDKCNEHYLAMVQAQEARQCAEVLAEEYRKDAERYRWLRDAPQDKIIVEAPDGEGNTFYAWGANLDAAIDAARKP